MSDENFKRIISVLMALATVATTIIAFVQSDAGARDDRANRDARRYSLEALGRRVSGDARVNFDYNSAYQAWYELDLLALSAENREDEAAALRYETLRDETIAFSPLLNAPYFNPETGETDIARYESDIYLVEVTALTERFVAAAAVKDMWDSKANTYIVHLTLLAVALFLYGLAVTLSGKMTRMLFSVVGSVIAVVAILWAGVVFAQPVPDLRDRTGAIDAYALGIGLSYQDRNDEALAEFNKAIAAAPEYANAYLGRAEVYMAQGKYAEAAADFEKAQANGNSAANVAGELAWAYYLLGRFDDAIAMNRTALAAGSGDLWIQFDLALAYLAKGDVAQARTEYQAGMDAAAKQVADAKAAGQQPPSDVWWSLDDAALSLESVLDVYDGIATEPPADRLAPADTVRPVVDELMRRLKSQAVSLEYKGEPPTGELTATISEFVFGAPIYDEEGNVTEYEPADEVEYGAQEVAVLFDYENMRDGDEVLFKVYIDGEEDPSWRVIAPWDLGASGTAEKPISLGYSDNFVLAPGYYVVEMYVNGLFAQRGAFVVFEP